MQYSVSVLPSSYPIQNSRMHGIWLIKPIFQQKVGLSLESGTRTTLDVSRGRSPPVSFTSWAIFFFSWRSKCVIWKPAQKGFTSTGWALGNFRHCVKPVKTYLSPPACFILLQCRPAQPRAAQQRACSTQPRLSEPTNTQCAASTPEL